MAIKTNKVKLLRVDQVSERLNISKRQAYRLVAEGHFISLKVGHALRVTHDSLDSYIERQINLFAIENGVRD